MLPAGWVGVRVCVELSAERDLQCRAGGGFVGQVTDLLREGSTIGAADDGADNHFHAHRWVLEGRADVPIDSVGHGNAHERMHSVANDDTWP